MERFLYSLYVSVIVFLCLCLFVVGVAALVSFVAWELPSKHELEAAGFVARLFLLIAVLIGLGSYFRGD